jgi:hypothetical protein
MRNKFLKGYSLCRYQEGVYYKANQIKADFAFYFLKKGIFFVDRYTLEK